jgi:hypothetical protein
MDISLFGAALAVEPGGQHLLRIVAATDQRRTDMPPEHRCAMVTAARILARKLPAMFPEPDPQHGVIGVVQGVGADAHYAAAAVGPNLVVFVEEVHAAFGPALPSGTARSRRGPPILSANYFDLKNSGGSP